ncbi:hypothetical protein OTU49_016213 [Cherax quadricarinatus]|uniref:Failed axon connections n=2 Tax=Cherax quadricarinatus TaxID=27406 RepID=A0AAW0Y924_CHEQU
MGARAEVRVTVSEGWHWAGILAFLTAVALLIGTLRLCFGTLTLVTAVVLLLGVFKICSCITKAKRRQRWEAAGQDVVVLHCSNRGRLAPSMSPFVIKLESFLRFAGIPYQLDFDEPFGPKGKTPWVTFNGEELADSQLILERLTEHFNLRNSLTKELQAIARAFVVMMDEHLIWGLRVWRYSIDCGAGFYECHLHVPFIVSVALPFLCWRMRRALWHQGMGRHTFAQVQSIVRKDLTAVSEFLGERRYLMGEELDAVDCVVFAHLANIVYNYHRSPFYVIVTEELPNLAGYVKRVRQRLWPDWNKCLDPPLPSQ